MREIEPCGTWEEEGRYVLRTLGDVKEELKHQGETAAADRAALLEKAVKDINVAHDRIRKLEETKEELQRTKTSLRIKNWAMAALIAGGGAVAFAVIERLIAGAK